MIMKDIKLKNFKILLDIRIILILNFRGTWWLHNGIGNIFLIHVGIFGINKRSFKCRNLLRRCDWPRDQTYDYDASILWGLFLTEHRTVTKMKNKGRVASTVIESHSSTAPLGCEAKEKNEPWTCSQRI